MFDFIYNPYLKLTNIDNNLLKIIHDNGIKESFNVEELIVAPYEYLDYFYFIESGLVKGVASDFNGKEKIILILGEGFCFGHAQIFLDASTEESYSRAIQPTEIYKIPKIIFLNLSNSSEIFRDYINKINAYTIFSMAKSIANKALYPSSKTLYDLFVYSAKLISDYNDIWYKLDYNLSHIQLADILGISLSTIQRSINTLRFEGKIRTINNEIEVKIPEKTYKHYFNNSNIILSRIK